MAHVTFIHGILNKPAPERLLAAWLEALASRGGPNLPGRGVTCSLVYWADVLYERCEEYVAEAVETAAYDAMVALHGDSGQGLFSPTSAKGEIVVARLAAKFEAVAAGLHTGEGPAAAVRPARVPLPWIVKRRFMEAYLRDVHHYLFNVEHSPRDGVRYRVRDEIRRRAVEALREAAQASPPSVVVAHSMGTVIAYDCLKRVADCPAIDGLLTAGSPLGLDEVQDLLRPEWTRRDGFPRERLRGGWVNVYDRLDPVAGFDPELANDFQREGARVVEDIHEPSSGRWRHDVVKYLAGARLRGALAELLGWTP